MPRVRGLVRARTSGPGWTRRRAGRGFVYLDEDLADAVASLLERRSPRARLLARREGRSWRPVRASDVNRYIQEISGTACTAKDFRTLHGSIIAARELARIGWSPDERERTRMQSRSKRSRGAC